MDNQEDGRVVPTGLSQAEPEDSLGPAADPQIDDSFTGLQARLLARFQDVIAERDRLSEWLTTIHVNALRATPETRARFVSFLVHAFTMSRGERIGAAVIAFEAAQKCSQCGAFSPVLGNGLCFECAPEGQWPCFARDSDGSPQGGDAGQGVRETRIPSESGSVHDSAGPKDIAQPNTGGTHV